MNCDLLLKILLAISISYAIYLLFRDNTEHYTCIKPYHIQPYHKYDFKQVMNDYPNYYYWYSPFHEDEYQNVIKDKKIEKIECSY